jgi:hypothetical protein
MKAIHVNWTAPFFHREKLRGHGFKVFRDYSKSEYFQPKYTVLATALSALWWKRENGNIKLYTDSIGAEYYEKIGLLDLYDEVDISTLESYREADPGIFWTSGKVRCLREEKDPFVFLDQDFIIRSKVPHFTEPIAIGHWEIPRGYYYFTREKFEKEITHCSFPENYDVNALVPNTSFLLFNDLRIRDLYVEMHRDLIDAGNSEVPEWFWLLTDQGILGHAIREMKAETATLTDRVYLSDSNHSDERGRRVGYSEPWFEFISAKPEKVSWEHLWYLKAVFHENEELRNKTEERLSIELKKFFDYEHQ